MGRARVLSFSARLRFLDGALDEALRIAGEALALAEELRLDELRAHALTTIGSAKNRANPSAGRAELERALEIATEANSPQVANILNNLGVMASDSGDIARAEELYRDGLRAAERIGDRDNVRFMRGNLLYMSFFRGRWDELARGCRPLHCRVRAVPPHAGESCPFASGLRSARPRRSRGALADLDRSLAKAREVKSPQTLLPALLQTAQGYALLGREDEARGFASEALEVARTHLDLAGFLTQITNVAKRLGIREDVRALLEQSPPTPWREVGLAGAEGDFVRAADIFAERGMRTLEADGSHERGGGADRDRPP